MIDRIARDYLPAALLVLGLLLGGSSSGGALANAVLQILTLLAASLVFLTYQGRRFPRALAGIVLLICALPLIQLIPLPPSLWTELPAREPIRRGFELASQPLPWLPLTLDQDATLAVIVALIPAGAMLVVTLSASARGLVLAMWGALLIAGCSVLLGLAQRLAGEGGGLQVYDLTNPGMAVGLFANRNHLGTLLVMAMPLATVLLVDLQRRWLVFAALAFLGLGAALTGSDAALLLALGVGGLCLISVLAWPRARRVWLALVLVAVTFVAAAAVWQVRQDSTADTPGVAEQHRPFIVGTTMRAAADHFPVGSGGGSFPRIYPRYEDPGQASPEYVSHAHSDYAEVLLEYGLPGGLAIAAVIGWLGYAALGLWRSPAMAGSAWAGLVMLGVALAHSLVDYPLRTAAIAMLAAFAAGLLHRTEPRPSDPLGGNHEHPADEGHARFSL